MDNQEKRVSVDVHFGERGTIYGCGHSLDTMLYAHEVMTEDELFGQNADGENEVVEAVMRDYDFKQHVREWFNRYDREALSTMLELPLSDEYLPGDALYFDQKVKFRELVNAAEERAHEILANAEYDDYTEGEFVQLAKDMREAREWFWDTLTREWLHGDRHEAGALKWLGWEMFGRGSDASVSWEPKTDTVNIEAAEDDWREYLSYRLDEREPLPTDKELAERVKEDTLRLAEKRRGEAERKATITKEKLEAQEKRKTDQLEKEKQEARERKNRGL